MKERPGADWGSDRPQGMLSAGDSMGPEGTSFVRNISVKPLSHSISAEWVAHWWNLYIRTRRATGLSVARREKRFTQTQSVARWSHNERAAYRLREALSDVQLFLFTGARCSIFSTRREITISEGTGISVQKLVFLQFALFLRCGAAMLCFLFRTYHKKKRS